MITIIYDEKEKDMILQASGHAGYAEKGSDIVCAAVSALMQTLAYSVDGGTVTRSQDDCNTLTVQAEQSFDNMAKFELVTDGLMLLAKQYPENMRFVNLHANDTDNVDLQLFAATATTAACGGNREELLGQRPAGHECRSRHEMDAGSRNPLGGVLNLQFFAEGAVASGSAAGDGAESAPAVQEPALRPAQERMARRSRPGSTTKANPQSPKPGEETLSPLPSANGDASRSSPEEEARNQGSTDERQSEGKEQNKSEEKKELTAAEKRRAFGKL